ncbi:uncharacterized protein LOC141592617 [Silene latifolia]|uniref:uncharacterized protein LOC141592617 n=1 Tax=Silene latifolia TaxID=37657 RepID=UPI003D7794DB
MTSNYTPNMNFRNDSVSPRTPPPSEDAYLMKYLQSAQSSDHSSPYLSRPIINRYGNSVTGSGGSSGGSNRTPYRNNITGSGGSSGGSNRTPLSLENLELSPLVKVEEDVLVMDDVLVNSNSGLRGSSSGSGSVSGRSSGERFLSSSSSSSGGSLYKTKLCKSWEDSRYCPYGFKCQFAHGHEELRPLNNRIRDMKKLEDVQMQMTKSKCSPLSSPYSPSNLLSSDSKTSTQSSTASSTSKLTKPSPLLSKDWSPVDDGIAVSLPGSTTDTHPSRVDVDEYINHILYGPTTGKRLPVFRDICPDPE